MSPRNFRAIMQGIISATGPYSDRDRALMQALYDFFYARGFADFGLDLFFTHFQRGTYENCINRPDQDRNTSTLEDGQGEAAKPEDLDSG